MAATKEIVAYFNEYFGVRYTLPKLDQLAVHLGQHRIGATDRHQGQDAEGQQDLQDDGHRLAAPPSNPARPTARR